MGGKDREIGCVHAEVTEYADAASARDYIDGLMTAEAFLYTDESPIYNGIRRNHPPSCTRPGITWRTTCTLRRSRVSGEFRNEPTREPIIA